LLGAGEPGDSPELAAKERREHKEKEHQYEFEDTCKRDYLAGGGTNYAAYQGYLVTHDGTTATVSASATTRAQGVILEPGKDANSKVTIACWAAWRGPSA